MMNSSISPLQEGGERSNNGWQDILLHNPDRLRQVPTGNNDTSSAPSNAGHSPRHLPLDEYLRYGIISLKKPHPLDSCNSIKTILGVKKIGYGGAVATHAYANNLIICLGSATSLCNASLEYFCVTYLHSDAAKIRHALTKLTSPIFQRRWHRRIWTDVILRCKLLEYDQEAHIGRFCIFCDDGTNISTFFADLGNILGIECRVKMLKRLHSRVLGKEDTMVTVTMQDVIDAHRAYEDKGDESYLRQVVMPLEILLTGYKRLVVTQASLHLICCGMKKLFVDGLLKFEAGIDSGDEVVLMTARGEAIGLGISVMASTAIPTSSGDAMVAVVNMAIRDQDTYIVNAPKEGIDQEDEHKNNHVDVDLGCIACTEKEEKTRKMINDH